MIALGVLLMIIVFCSGASFILGFWFHSVLQQP